MKEVSIFIADADPLTRLGLCALLEQKRPRWKVTAEALTGEQAVQRLTQLKPDIFVMSISRDHTNALTAVKTLLEMLPAMRVLVVTEGTEQWMIDKTHKVGARGHLPMKDVEENFVLAIEELLAGRTFLDASVLETRQSLSPREIAVLKLLAQGIKNKDIALALNISVRSVEDDRQEIMSKLKVRDLPGLIRYAVRERLIDP